MRTVHLVPIAFVLTSASAIAAPKLPAHYAKLFDPKATWTFEIVRDGVAEPDVTCKVAQTITFGSSTASEITCDREVQGFPVPDAYVATPSGLYRSNAGFPTTREEIRDTSMHQRLLQAKPKTSSEKVTRYGIVDHKSIPEVTTFGIKRDGKVWCWYRTTERTTSKHTDTRCFSDGGIAYGVENKLVFRAR